MVDLGEDEEKFDAFMIPITQSFESLGQVLLNSGSSEKTFSLSVSVKASRTCPRNLEPRLPFKCQSDRLGRHRL